MSDLPYTDDDLRAEAARQHAFLAEDPDFVGVGERMDGTEVCPDGGVTWDDFCTKTYEAAQRKIHDLIQGAADTSEWAVNLGADGLEPDEHAITIGADEKPIARVHFAFEPGMPDEMRTALVEGIGQAINAHL